MMRPQAYFQTFFSNFSNWAGLKHFYSHFRSGFTIIYGKNYAFFLLFTKALLTDRQRDGPTDGLTDGWTDGWTDGRMDTPSYRDARTHLKMGERASTPFRRDLASL